MIKLILIIAIIINIFLIEGHLDNFKKDISRVDGQLDDLKKDIIKINKNLRNK